MSKKCSIIILVLMMLVSVFYFSYWAIQKDGYHCDEMFSFGLSNTNYYYYNDHDDSGNIKWNTDTEIDAYMAVSKDGRFDYVNVYQNQRRDVHPPLFYFIIHTISSFFPEVWSKYMIIVPNILFALGTAVFLFLTSMEILKKRSLSLVSVFFYLFSVNCVNMITFLRMYSMLAFFTTMALYSHLKFMKNDFVLTKKIAITLATSVLLGMLTQYYFLIYIFSLFLFTSIYILIFDEKKKLFNYVKLLSAIAIIYVILWPWSIKHLFFSYRGVEARDAAISSPLIDRFFEFSKILCNGISPVLCAFLLISIGLCVVYCLKNHKIFKLYLKKYSNIVIVLGTTVFYTLILIKVIPYVTDRYFSPIFPLLALLSVWSVNIVCSRIFKMNMNTYMLLGFCMIITLGIFINTKNLLWEGSPNSKEFTNVNKCSNYLYHKSEDIKNILENAGDKKCLCINGGEWFFLNGFTDYKHFEATAFVSIDEFSEITNLGLSNENEFVLYVYSDINTDDIARKTTERLGFDSYKLIACSPARNDANIYSVYKEN